MFFRASIYTIFLLSTPLKSTLFCPPLRPSTFYLGCVEKAYTAYALFKAFEGFGTDEDRVVRLLGGTDKRKMAAVAEYYLETYGKSIVEDLKDELSGNFLQVRKQTRDPMNR